MDVSTGTEDVALADGVKLDTGDQETGIVDKPDIRGADDGTLNVHITHTEQASDLMNTSVVSDIPDSDVSECPVDTSNDVAEQEEQNNSVTSPGKETESHIDNNQALKIITQVEYYFSDENLVKDSFLMQRITRDKRGYVDLKLIASFKKMKKLTQDITVIASALRNSKKVEVNKAGTMIRRIGPLPALKDDPATKTVIAVNFSEISNLTEHFGTCGTVSKVRTISKDNTVPADVRKHLKRSLVDGTCALTDIAVIEFSDEKAAHASCVSLTDSSDWRHGLHVSMLMGKPSERKATSSTTNNQHMKSSPMKDDNAGEARRSPQPGEETHGDEMRAVRSKKKTNRKSRSRIEAILQDESAGCSSSGSETDGQDEQKERRLSSPKNKHGNSARRSSGPTGRSNFAQSVLAHQKASLADDLCGEVRARSGSTGALECGSRGVSPWVQRRLKAAQHDSKSAGGSLSDLSAGDAVTVGKTADLMQVLRQPRGPDGTRGFKLVRSS